MYFSQTVLTFPQHVHNVGVYESGRLYEVIQYNGRSYTVVGVVCKQSRLSCLAVLPAPPKLCKVGK